MCQNRTDSQKPLSGGWANVQGHATAQLQLSNQSPTTCHWGMSAMISSVARTGSRAEADAEPGANQIVRSLAEERRLDAGVESERRRQPVDEAGVQRELVALVALRARVVEELDE